MHYPSAPGCRTAEQEFGLFIAFEGGSPPARTPPAHGGQHWRTLLLTATDQQETYPLQTRDEDRLGGRGVVAFLVMGQALGFAGAHRTQPLGLLTLRLFPHTLIPNHQALFSGLRPFLQLLAGSLPEKARDEPGSPLARMQQVDSAVSCQLGPCPALLDSRPVRLRVSHWPGRGR